jgi:competence protein ComEA
LDPPSAPWRVFDTLNQAEAAATAVEPSAARLLEPAWLREPRVVAALAGAAILAIIAIALAVGGIGGSVTVDAAGEPGADASFGAAASGGAGPEIVVDVAGGVARPGVYRLAVGSRVADAVAAAGGFGPRVAAARVESELNLAAVLRDGQRVAVPSRDDPAAPAGGAGSPAAATGLPGASTGGGLIDLNRASQSELESLPGIGAVTAGKIIASRQEAPFRTVDELRERKLVGEKTFQKLRPLVTVG